MDREGIETKTHAECPALAWFMSLNLLDKLLYCSF